MPTINSNIMRSGSRLTRSHRLQLIEPFTKEELQTTLKGIGGSKVPGGDGFNAYFYKKT